MTIPRYAEQGIWKVTSIGLEDAAGNYHSGGNFSDADFDLTLTQSGAGDSTAPSLQSLSFSPATIDTSDAPAAVVVESRVTDSLSGFVSADVSVCSPSGTQKQRVSWNAEDRVSGNNNDGVYRAELIMPRYSAPETWYVCRVTLRDYAGNVHDRETHTDPTAAFNNDP